VPLRQCCRGRPRACPRPSSVGRGLVHVAQAIRQLTDCATVASQGTHKGCPYGNPVGAGLVPALVRRPWPDTCGTSGSACATVASQGTHKGCPYEEQRSSGPGRRQQQPSPHDELGRPPTLASGPRPVLRYWYVRYLGEAKG